VTSELVDLEGIVIEFRFISASESPPIFAAESIGEHKGYHRFTDYSWPREPRTSRSARRRLAPGSLVTMSAVPRGATERGDGLEVAADDDIFTIGDAAFETAGAIGGAVETAGRLVIGDSSCTSLRRIPRAVDTGANLDAFDGLDGSLRLERGGAVELFVPLRMAAPGRRECCGR